MTDALALPIQNSSDAIDDLERLLLRARESGDTRRELSVQKAVARACYVMSLDRKGYAEKAKEAYERAIQLARDLSEHKSLGESLVATATLVDYWPDFRPQAIANLQEAQRIALATDEEDLSIDVATARLSLVMRGEQADEDEAILRRLLARRSVAGGKAGPQHGDPRRASQFCIVTFPSTCRTVRCW